MTLVKGKSIGLIGGAGVNLTPVSGQTVTIGNTLNVDTLDHVITMDADVVVAGTLSVEGGVTYSTSVNAEWAEFTNIMLSKLDFTVEEDAEYVLVSPAGFVGFDDAGYKAEMATLLAEEYSTFRVDTARTERRAEERDGEYIFKNVLTVTFRFVGLADLVEGK